jgi:hypothetical protein
MGDEGTARRDQVLARLPDEVRRAVEARDLPGLKAALAELPPTLAAVVVQRLREVGILAGAAPPPEAATLVEDFAPLLADIVAIARGDDSRRDVVEQVLGGLAEAGWQLVLPVTMIWEGERDEGRLTADLEDEEKLLVRRVLELLR